jgi:hypothetical protein
LLSTYVLTASTFKKKSLSLVLPSTTVASHTVHTCVGTRNLPQGGDPHVKGPDRTYILPLSLEPLWPFVGRLEAATRNPEVPLEVNLEAKPEVSPSPKPPAASQPPASSWAFDAIAPHCGVVMPIYPQNLPPASSRIHSNSLPPNNTTHDPTHYTTHSAHYLHSTAHYTPLAAPRLRSSSFAPAYLPIAPYAGHLYLFSALSFLRPEIPTNSASRSTRLDATSTSDFALRPKVFPLILSTQNQPPFQPPSSPFNLVPTRLQQIPREASAFVCLPCRGDSLRVRCLLPSEAPGLNEASACVCPCAAQLTNN